MPYLRITPYENELKSLKVAQVHGCLDECVCGDDVCYTLCDVLCDNVCDGVSGE